MGLFGNFFSSSSEPPIEKIETYEDFWKWFSSREREFHKVVREQGDFERDFFDHLNPRLDQLHEGLYLLSGMMDEHTAELIITPDGVLKNIVFAEEIVAAAPSIDGWKFTALKPASGEAFDLAMGDFVIESNSLFFVSTNHWERPDEIDIVIVHESVSEENRDAFSHAIDLFLDNYLGELHFITEIDNLEIAGTNETTEELRPLSELKDYLQDRQRRFREKYYGYRENTEEDPHTLFEWESDDGMPIIAVMNTTLLTWDSKPSHPWIAIIEFEFQGGENGLTNEETFDRLSLIEDEIMDEMPDTDGYLNVGRQTGNSIRTVFFACKDFRLPSKIFHLLQRRFIKEFKIDFAIYKDKYWQTFDRFLPVENDEHVN